MARHTPGPWKFGHLGTEALWIGPDYDQTPVAHIDHDMEFARDNSRANAEFIVRACNSHHELLDALEGVLPTNLCLTNSNVRDDTVVSLDCNLGDLRKIAALLERARGGQS